MALAHSPLITVSGLEVCLDASNPRSYLGSGTNWYDISGQNNIFGASNYTYPSIGGSGLKQYFVFVNNGSTVNNIYSSTTTVNTSTETVYTRIGWFYLTATSNDWSPIVQNSIGNNADMCLMISGGKVCFHQYTNVGGSNADYTVSGSGTVSTNTWYQAAFSLDRSTNALCLYLNGALDTSTTVSSIGNSSSNTISIGGATTDSYSGNRMFKGYIGQVLHYNTILTADQIAQNFAAYRGRYGI